MLGAGHMTLAQAMAHSFEIWFFGNGRFYPLLVVEKYLVFAIFTNLIAYKLLLIAATLVVLELFRRCVAAYAGDEFAAVAALAAAALLLVHGYQDALIAYNAMPQAVAIAMLGSLMAFRAGIVSRSPAMTLLAAALYLIAALVYEDAYVLCFLYPVLARGLCADRRSAVRAAAPQLAIAFALSAFVVWLHARAQLPPDALYALRWEPAAMLSTGFYQIIAPLPLVYWLADPPRGFPSAAAAIESLVVFAAFAVLAVAVIRGESKAAVRSHAWAAGTLLAILPALPLAVLVKYQQELRPGLGYLPSFFQVFGLALLAAGLAQLLSRRFGDRANVAIGVIFGFLAAAAFAGNAGLASADQPQRAARFALQDQLQSGLIAAVPNGSTIAIPRSFNWIAYDDSGPDGISPRGLLYTYARRRADLEPPEDPRAQFALQYSGASKAWSLRAIPRIPATGPPACNGGGIVNGSFSFGLRCWTAVPAAAARIESENVCFPEDLAGKPYASLAAQSYLAQTFVYRGLPERVEMRVWSEGRSTVSVGVVFPVGTGIGSERLLDSFDPPAVLSDSGRCTGLHPVVKQYRFSGYPRGERIQLRLHAAGGRAAFDSISSEP